MSEPGGDYRYKKLFDPDRRSVTKIMESSAAGDRVAPAGYDFTPQAVLAVNVALATGRPLLVRGAPGSGKSTLAEAVAKAAGWAYLAHVVTSRTPARDLLWTFDAVRRLHDATANRPVDNLAAYIRPGVLWEAFDPVGAREVGAGRLGAGVLEKRAVVLIDEIDKAEPDVPNDLLVPLGAQKFVVSDYDEHLVQNKRREPPLIVMTTNRERDLPGAFLRRSVVLTLPFPDEGRLAAIAALHFPDGDHVLHAKLAEIAVEVRDEAKAHRAQPPSTAEYLDAIRACRELGVQSDSPEFHGLRDATLTKWRADGDTTAVDR
jgi:MoxR-like ATPase